MYTIGVLYFKGTTVVSNNPIPKQMHHAFITYQGMMFPTLTVQHGMKQFNWRKYVRV